MRKIITLISLISILLLIMSRSASFVPPSTSIIIAITGLGFPLIWLINLCILLLLFILRFRGLKIAVILVLVMTLPMMLRYFSLPFKGKESKSDYSVFSFNTFGFRIHDSLSNQLDNQRKTHTLINAHDFSLACFQEYPMKGARHAPFYANLMDGLELPHKHLSNYHPEDKSAHNIFVTASAFPLVFMGTLVHGGTDFAMYSDIAFPGKTIRIYNIHLQSVKFTKERKLLLLPVDSFNPRTIHHYLIGAYNKLSTAFLVRELQATMLKKSILESPYPVLIAGDFNDTPVSYAYQIISEGMKDASYLSTTGFIRTFKFSSFPLQIDYIMHDTSFKSSEYRFFVSPVSDHKAISSKFNIQE